MKTIKRISKKAMVKPALLLAIVLIVSCSKDKPNNPDNCDPLADSSDVELQINTVASFNADTMELPESITLDEDGNIYLSMSPLREIWKLNSSGTFLKIVASFPLEPGLLGINGLKFDPEGNLCVAIFSTIPEMNGVWRINSNGDKERIPGTGNIPLPNDLAIMPDGTIYTTDALMGGVWRNTGGEEAELWIQDEAFEGTGAFGLGFPLGANGIVVTQDENALLGEDEIGGVIVANTEKGQLVYVPILPDQTAGEPIIMVANPDVLFGLDGITIDENGTIYGAVNAGGTIVRISDKGSNLSELVSGAPLDFPTSLAFGSGADNHTLFITSFGVIHFLSDPPMPGDASPAVISVKFECK